MNDVSTQPYSVLFLLAHPHLQRSRANSAVVRAVSGTPGVTVHRLYDLYPYFHIDVAREQALLLAHDLIVIQHPFYWYSMPPLLKMWLDEVLVSGWAYGPGGNRLHGKNFLLSITAGGSESAYSLQGQNRYSMDTLLSPWNQTVHLCHMRWHSPRILHSSIEASDQELRRHSDRIREDLATFVRRGALP